MPSSIVLIFSSFIFATQDVWVGFRAWLLTAPVLSVYSGLLLCESTLHEQAVLSMKILVRVCTVLRTSHSCLLLYIHWIRARLCFCPVHYHCCSYCDWQALLNDLTHSAVHVLFRFYSVLDTFTNPIICEEYLSQCSESSSAL